MGVKVRERPDKGWYVFINWRGQRRAKGFGKDRKGAVAFAQKLAARLKWAEVNGEPLALSQPEQAMPTVKTYVGEWVEGYAKVHCKPSTYRGYKRSLDQQLVPAFGDRPLHLLKREDVKRFIARLSEQGKSKGTIQNCLVPLKAAYNQAMEDGIVTFNPVARLGRLLRGRQDRRAHIHPLTKQEVIELLGVAEQRFPALYPVVLCAVRTGLRMGELIGLQWGDVDFHGRFVEVRRSVVLRQETTTKNHKIRRVDMSPQLQAVLQRVKEVQQLEAMNQGREMPLSVFLSPEGCRWDEGNLRRGWYALLVGAGVRRVRFHDLRHTFASLLIEQGAHPKYIQEQMGHGSIQVTMDVYGHLFPSGNREWVGKLDEAGWEAKTATQPQPQRSVGERSGVEVGEKFGAPDTN